MDGFNYAELVINLVLSLILTWGIGLSWPLVVRFLIARRPLSKPIAILLTAAFWLLNLIIFVALGSQSKTHAALFFVALVSYYIMHKGYTRPVKTTEKVDEKHTEKELVKTDQSAELTKPPKIEQKSDIGAPSEFLPRAKHKKTCSLAIVSLILGILGLLLFCVAILPGLPAVICGYLALSKIKRSDNTLKGRGIALAGLSMGYVAIVFTALMVLIGFIQGFKEGYKESIKNILYTQYSESEDRWPSAFDPEHQSGAVARFEAQHPKFTEELVTNMGQAIGFWVGQEYSINKLIELFPQLRPRVILAKTNFNNKLGPAIKYMEQIFADQIPNWAKSRQQIVDTIVAQTDFEQLTQEDAEAYIVEFEKRAQGQVPSPILETTLMFHPDYISNPEREHLDGFTREYRSDGTGKSRGVKIGIEYPASWRVKEGRRPHVVQKITSQNGKGFESVMITIAQDPDNLSEEDFVLLQAEELCDNFAPGTRTVDYGTVHIAGKRSIWGEFDLTTQRVGVEMEVHGLIFVFLHKGNFVILMFDTASSPSAMEENAKERFDHYARLFQLMLNSVDFLDRYERTY